MSREMLSQDEIDALLRQGTFTQEDKKINLDDYLSPFDQDALGEIGNISFGSASTALSTLLGQKVEITTPSLSAIHKDGLENQFPQPHVAVHVEYTEGFKGVNLFVLKSNDAKVIADLMMGGNGLNIQEGDLSEMHISAVQEAMNQMMGSAATSMSTVFNTVVNISPPGVDIINLSEGQGSNNIPDDDILVLVSFRLKIGTLIDSNIMQLITVPFARTLISRLTGSGTEEVSVASEPIQQQQHVAAPPISQVAVQEGPLNNTQYAEPPVYQHQPMQQPIPQPVYQQPIQQHAFTQRSNTVNPNVNVQPAQFMDFNNNHAIINQDPNLGLLMDIPLQITVELGRTKRLIKDILELSQGSIIELDKLAGEPVDIFANNKLIAKGEVVVIDENFGVRVTDILSQYERVKKLQ